eukprot:RCo049862
MSRAVHSSSTPSGLSSQKGYSTSPNPRNRTGAISPSPAPRPPLSGAGAAAPSQSLPLSESSSLAVPTSPDDQLTRRSSSVAGNMISSIAELLPPKTQKGSEAERRRAGKAKENRVQ